MASNKDELKAKGSAARRTPRRVFHRVIGVLMDGEYSPVQALQISEGGLLFRATREFQMQCSIVLSLIIPGGRGIVVRGSVIYEVKAGQSADFGVKFDALPIPTKRLIRNYVSAKTQAEAELESDDFK